MKIDFKQLSIKDLDGIEYISPDTIKTFGNLLYRFAETIEHENYARAIHAGQELELTSLEVQDLARLIETACMQSNIQPIVRRGILNFLTIK